MAWYSDPNVDVVFAEEWAKVLRAWILFDLVHLFSLDSLENEHRIVRKPVQIRSIMAIEYIDHCK